MVNFSTVLSPYFALATSLILAIIAILPSNSFYRENFGENSLVTFNPLVISWIALCSTFYVLGIYVAGRFFKGNHRRNRRNVLELEIDSYRFRISILCAFVILLNLYGLMQLYSFFGFRGFISAMIGIGDVDLRLAVYNALKAVNTGWAIAFTAPVASIVFVVLIKNRDKILLSLFVVLMTVHLALILATQSKGPIFTLITSLVVCTQLLKFPKLLINKRAALKFIAFALTLSVIFLAIQSRRNPEILSINGFSKEISAYTIVSYNRLAYLIDGRLHIPNMYMGFWTNRWLWGLPGEGYGDFLLSKAQFDIPYGAFDAWLNTFSAVKSAGLNEKYIWITIYGEVFADYRWFGFFWFFIYGLGSKFAYEDMKIGHIRSYAVYPFILQCNYSWYSGATISTRTILFCILIAIYLSIPKLKIFGSSKYTRQEENYVAKSRGSASENI